MAFVPVSGLHVNVERASSTSTPPSVASTPIGSAVELLRSPPTTSSGTRRLVVIDVPPLPELPPVDPTVPFDWDKDVCNVLPIYMAWFRRIQNGPISPEEKERRIIQLSESMDVMVANTNAFVRSHTAGDSQNVIREITHHLCAPMGGLAETFHHWKTAIEKKEGIENEREKLKDAIKLCGLLPSIIIQAKDALRGVSPNSVPFSVLEAIRDAKDLIGMTAETKGIELKFNLFGLTKDHAVMGNKLDLTLTLTNLISNAIKFSSQEKVVDKIITVSVRAVKNFAGQSVLRFSVADCAGGMTEDVLRKVRGVLDGASSGDALFTTGQVEGSSLQSTGIGLPTCRENVKKMGSRIQADVERDSSGNPIGSRFYFDLRPFEGMMSPTLSVASSSSSKFTQSPRVVRAQESFEKKNIRILKADDTSLVLRLAKTEFKKASAEGFYQTIQTGREAVEAFQAVHGKPGEEFDLVELDLHFAEGEEIGLAFARDILEISPETPIIIYSGYEEKVIKSDIAGARPDLIETASKVHYFLKPAPDQPAPEESHIALINRLVRQKGTPAVHLLPSTESAPREMGGLSPLQKHLQRALSRENEQK